jgi:hypothetical protein
MSIINRSVSNESDVARWFTIAFPCPVDPDGDAIHFQLVLSTSEVFATPLIDWDTRSTEDGVDGWTVFTGTTFEDMAAGGVLAGFQGNGIAYRFQSIYITRDVLYYLRIRAHDGTDWGPWTGKVMTW